MATRLKRFGAAVLAVGALGALGASGASAQSSGTGTFASPVSAPGTQPMWIRSITPCPTPDPGEVSFVVARIIHAISDQEDNVVWGDVRDDGHWDVTLVTPAGPSGGATGRYYVQVQCAEKLPPPAASADDLLPEVTLKYVSRELQVTAGAATGAQWIDGEVGGPATTTTTAPPTTTTTSTTAAPAGNTPAAVTGGSTSALAAKAGTATKSAWAVPKTEAAEIQAEIVERASADDIRAAAAAAGDDAVALNASPASAGRDQAADGGIPPWAFACAAMLAVGAVIAWGQRRSAALDLVAPASIAAEIDE